THTSCALTPEPTSVTLTPPITVPWATAARDAADRPPSNSTISASMQRLAKMPRPRAINGGVCTTFGGVVAAAIVSFLSPLGQLFPAFAGAAPAATVIGVPDGVAAAAGAPCCAGAVGCGGAAGAFAGAGAHAVARTVIDAMSATGARAQKRLSSILRPPVT